MARTRCEPDLVEQLQRTLAALATADAGADQRNLDVTLGCQAAEQVVLLEDEANQVASMARRASTAPQLAAVDQDTTCGRLLEPADQVQQRALARP
jgi:hypothetical protein